MNDPVTALPSNDNPLGRPRVLGRGEAERTYSARGSVMMFKALAEQDGADLSLMERTLPPCGRRPPAHRHPDREHHKRTSVPDPVGPDVS